MNIFQEIFGHHITFSSKRIKGPGTNQRSKDLAWVYVGQNPAELKACRSLKTLLKLAEEDFYITPNGFYHSKNRCKDTLRWLNAIVLDYDDMTLPDVIDNISLAGLPMPSFFVFTPHNGIHAWWLLDKPLRCGVNNKALYLYEAIQKTMAKATEACPGGLGAERIYRVPAKSRIYIPSEHLKRVKLSTLVEWRDINYSEDMPTEKNKNNILIFRKGILDQPFFRKLLQGVEEGQRNHASLTLALAMKYEGYTVEQTLEALLQWDKKNVPNLGYSRIKTTIRYAYRCKSVGPSQKRVLDIFGHTFNYKAFTPTFAKKREERKRTHIKEWAEDILKFIEKNGGVWKGSQRELAVELKAPKRSIEEAIKLLRKTGKITTKVIGKGRAARTVVTLLRVAKVMPVAAGGEQLRIFQSYYHALNLIPHTDKYTFDAVVGGCLRSPP